MMSETCPVYPRSLPNWRAEAITVRASSGHPRHAEDIATSHRQKLPNRREHRSTGNFSQWLRNGRQAFDEELSGRSSSSRWSGSPPASITRSTKASSYGAFARLSVRELIFRAGQGELKNGASRFIHIRPQPAPMGIDDAPADRQPHPHPAGLRCVESLKNALDMLRIDARNHPIGAAGYLLRARLMGGLRDQLLASALTAASR